MTELRWGPRPGAFVFGGVIAAAGVVWIIAANRPGDRIVGGAVVLAVVAATLAGLRLRERLRATPSGLVVGTLTGRRDLTWSQIGRIEVVSRRRLGSTSRSLEIDLDNDELLVFGQLDLGTDPTAVADALSRIRTGAG